MGVTGAGKTTFISHFAPGAMVGHGLESCTQEVGIHAAVVGRQRIYLIDTPGFDDTRRSDTDVLREVANWLNASYRARITLAGIVYLHRIGDNRMSGSAMKNLRMFRQLVGDAALSCVVLATTMWSMVPSVEEGAAREHELKTNRQFWAGMVDKGSVVFRQDAGAASARRIVQYLVAQRQRVTLTIQHEMANGKTLDETSAGREVQAEMEAIKMRHKAELAELRTEMAEARAAHDKQTHEELAAVRADLEAKLRRDREDRDKMRVGLEQLRIQRDAELARERDEQATRTTEMNERIYNLKFELEAQRGRNQASAEIKAMELKLLQQKADNERMRLQVAQVRADAERSSCSVM
ncbi:hypothetical protein B0T26DRAFT_749072 [Lasiosphaeria miniovina]|uniref:G domain-containing protein n=1 Tax=Lasiosphaeria miniovina TaxID=1954250 RepID=A0AA40DZL9_9PEZI|nr:uncharacterized protein B0T26DRAFT_749072 [Lasiosphaeria miniovina]KAK0721565.1 hypothetical protein B0T26DRAFT_749072 [Lasiosphaeria miniovina]